LQIKNKLQDFGGVKISWQELSLFKRKESLLFSFSSFLHLPPSA
jgi:hypothetical protein